MTIVDLCPPIALATLVSTLWLLVAYRLYKRDRASGSDSLQQAIWIVTGPGLIGGFFYVHGFKEPIVGGLDIFMTALAGIAMGVLLVFVTKNTFFDGSLGRKDRVINGFYLVFLLFICGSSLFY